jgi:hypothetical protein
VRILAQLRSNGTNKGNMNFPYHKSRSSALPPLLPSVARLRRRLAWPRRKCRLLPNPPTEAIAWKSP